MTIMVRRATDADWPGFRLCAEVSFGNPQSDGRFGMFRSLFEPPGWGYVAREGDAVVGTAGALSFRLTVPGGAQLDAAGVSWVSVLPTHRRRGVLRAMYDTLHADLDVPVAILTASEATIYGRFGYGSATVTASVRVDRRAAVFRPDAPDPGGVRIMSPADAAELLPPRYDRWRAQTPGAFERSPAMWDRIVADPEDGRTGGKRAFAMVHEDGYALWRNVDGETRSARVEELRACTDEARIALWRTLIGLDFMHYVTADTGPDEPLPHALLDARAVRTLALRDGIWVRIMDVPAALSARTYRAALDVVLDVHDPYLNAGGRFRLTTRDGHAECVRTDAAADAECQLDTLGSMYLGGHSAATLAAANRLRTKDFRTLQALDLAFGTERAPQLGYFF